MTVQFRRPDGSFVLLRDGLPYHVVREDPLFDVHSTAAAFAPIEQTAPAPSIEQVRARMTLTFAQLLIGLVSEGWISEVEGENWLSGTLPAPVLGLISTLPAGQQFAARARALRPSVVMRTDPLVVALAAAQGKSPTEIDTFFATYAQV